MKNNTSLESSSSLQSYSSDTSHKAPHSFSLEPQKRVRKRREFNHVFHKNFKVVSSHLVVLVQKNTGENARLGLVVSKKVGNAVRRNYVKRCLRELFRTTHYEKNLDVIVIARPRCNHSDHAQLERAWKFCMCQVFKRYKHRKA